MGKGKLIRWAENKSFEHVFEPDLLPIIREGKTFMKGEWHSTFFKNDHPLVIELGCGKGEYTVGLARRFPDKNFLGADVKGHRFHKGAKEALTCMEKLKRVLLDDEQTADVSGRAISPESQAAALLESVAKKLEERKKQRPS